jgi:hypothetical protein
LSTGRPAVVLAEVPSFSYNYYELTNQGENKFDARAEIRWKQTGEG